MSRKKRGLLFNLILYSVAFVFGMVPFFLTRNIFIAEALFTVTSAFVIFISTCIITDVSLYDPYWSTAPPVMILLAMIKYGLWNGNALIILLGILIWSVRLTGNWEYTYKGVGFEDWRYSSFRNSYSKAAFVFISFAGFHYVPTIVTYAGLVGALFVIQVEEFNPLVLVGFFVMTAGTFLEYIADRSLHRFLSSEDSKGKSCNVSVWKYSRHPNYLGEMIFWLGIFISFALLMPDRWFFGLGFLLIYALLIFASIPMMERHNMERRSDYGEYRKRTSVLLLLPGK